MVKLSNGQDLQVVWINPNALALMVDGDRTLGPVSRQDLKKIRNELNHFIGFHNDEFMNPDTVILESVEEYD